MPKGKIAKQQRKYQRPNRSFSSAVSRGHDKEQQATHHKQKVNSLFSKQKISNALVSDMVYKSKTT